MNDCDSRPPVQDILATSTFVSPTWLRNPHAQTVYASVLAPRPRVNFRRERWESPDGDFIDLDWLPTPMSAPCAVQSPTVILFHGLEGSSQSHYARALMHAVAIRGWHGGVVHFRGCSGEANRLPRAYHSGDSAEIDWILRRLRSVADGPIFAAAVSLGANALLKWLGERGADAGRLLVAAAAVSAPLDLACAGDALGRGFNRFYTWNFLRTLKRKSLQKLRRYPDLFEQADVRRARTLRTFDDHVTAPLHGFVDAEDYWRRSSSKPVLAHIAVPTLVLNARDDPFLPAHALPGTCDVSPHVVLEFPAHGGHAAFVTGAFPGSLTWMPRRVLSFFTAALTAGQPARAGVA